MWGHERLLFLDDLTIMTKSKFLSKFKQNNLENEIVEPVFINFKYTGTIKL